MKANQHYVVPRVLRPATREQIQALAYALWEDRGCPVGKEVELWLEAERLLQRQSAPPYVVAADEIPADPSNLDRDPAVDGGELEAELDRLVQPGQPRSPTSL